MKNARTITITVDANAVDAACSLTKCTPEQLAFEALDSWVSQLLGRPADYDFASDIARQIQDRAKGRLQKVC